MLTLLFGLAVAASLDDDFGSDLGAWTGGSVADGVLSVTDEEATLPLAGARSLTGTVRLRLVAGERVWLALGDQHWIADYRDGGGLSLGLEELAFPPGHFQMVADPDPVLGPDGAVWDGGNTLHCEAAYDEDTATWLLFWTGEMISGYAYRQIGVATSTDAEHWTEYAGNPVLTIDYDRTTIDGIHVHMPTIARDDDGGWEMYYACYQNDVGNRICRATSPDGLSWTPQGMALDHGVSGEFDSGSLREPDVLRTEDGAWHMLYNGTDPTQHYGPTGYARSLDGVTWEKRGAITADETMLQGGSMLATPWGVLQWYNVDDHFELATADPADLTSWTEQGEALTKDFAGASWAAGYIQAPSALQIGLTYHLWFNAYGQLDGAWNERIGHARSVPAPGAWIDLDLAWDGETLTVGWDGVELSTSAHSLESLAIGAEGTAEIDAIALSWTEAEPADTGGDSVVDTGDDAPGDSALPDSGAPSEDSSPTAPSEAKAGCGCAQGADVRGFALALVGGLLAARRRAARPSRLGQRRAGRGV